MNNVYFYFAKDLYQSILLSCCKPGSTAVGIVFSVHSYRCGQCRTTMPNEAAVESRK